MHTLVIFNEHEIKFILITGEGVARGNHGGVEERLDRVSASVPWTQVFPNAKVCHLPFILLYQTTPLCYYLLIILISLFAL